MAKLSTKLFNGGRKVMKAASLLNTAETIATGDPTKIAKHLARKEVNKAVHGNASKCINKMLK